MENTRNDDPTAPRHDATVDPATDPAMKQPAEKEIGGPKETEPTRYGDWTVKGRCIDF